MIVFILIILFALAKNVVIFIYFFISSFHCEENNYLRSLRVIVDHIFAFYMKLVV